MNATSLDPQSVAAATVDIASAVSNPYVGPVPLSDGQMLYGREREIDELADLIVSKRVVLLFSPSGAGKTSLIQAALAPALRDQYRLQPLPIVRLGHHDSSCDGDVEVNRYALATLRALERRNSAQQRMSDSELCRYSLARYFDERLDAGRGDDETSYRLLIFDQFEELFTADPLDVDQKRAFQIGRAHV